MGAVARPFRDLAFLRDQIITTEVNIARSYNFSVKVARKRAAAAVAASGLGAGAPAAANTAAAQA